MICSLSTYNRWPYHHRHLVPYITTEETFMWSDLGPVLLLRHDAVTRILANGKAALLLVERLATASDRCSKTGPWASTRHSPIVIGLHNYIWLEHFSVLLTNPAKTLTITCKQKSQGLKLTLIPRSDFLLLLLKSWSKSDHHRSYFLSLKPDIWLDWVAKLCS